MIKDLREYKPGRYVIMFNNVSCHSIYTAFPFLDQKEEKLYLGQYHEYGIYVMTYR